MTEFKYQTKEEIRTKKVAEEVEKCGFKFIRVIKHIFKDIERTKVEAESLECKHKFETTLGGLREKKRKGDKLCTKSTCRKKYDKYDKRRKWDIERVKDSLDKGDTNLKVDPSVYEITREEGYPKVKLVCKDCGVISYIPLITIRNLETGRRNKVHCVHCTRERKNKDVEEFFKEYHPNLEFIKTFREEGQLDERTMYRCKTHKKVYIGYTKNLFTREKHLIPYVSGCPECATSGIKHDYPYIVYYLRIWDEELLQWLYKIGITWGTEKADAERRMKQISKKMQLVEIVGEFDNYYAARAEELRLHELYKKDSVPIEYMEERVNNGGSEFFYRDVLEADIQSEQIPILI